MRDADCCLTSAFRGSKVKGHLGCFGTSGKCKSQSIFAESSCEISRGSTVLNIDIEGVNLQHVNMIIQEAFL